MISSHGQGHARTVSNNAGQIKSLLDQLSEAQAALEELRNGKPAQHGRGDSDKANAAFGRALAQWEAQVEALRSKIEHLQEELKVAVTKLQSQELISDQLAPLHEQLVLINERLDLVEERFDLMKQQLSLVSHSLGNIYSLLGLVKETQARHDRRFDRVDQQLDRIVHLVG